MKRRATKIFSVRLGKRLPVALMTMALAAANMAFAQEENPWVGEALPAEGGEFYLYNKSGDGFLLGPIPGVHKVPWDNRDYCAR